MPFHRLDVERHPLSVVARFLPPPRHERYDGVALRDELIQLVELHPHRTLVVDFGDFQMYPAELLACLVHVRGLLKAPGPIRCVNLPLRLQVACRFLSLEDSVLKLCNTVEEALDARRLPDWAFTPAKLGTRWVHAA